MLFSLSNRDRELHKKVVLSAREGKASRILLFAAIQITAARSCCDVVRREGIAGCKINRKLFYNNNTYSSYDIVFFDRLAILVSCTSEAPVIARRHLEIQILTSTRIDLKARCHIDIIPLFLIHATGTHTQVIGSSSAMQPPRTTQASTVASLSSCLEVKFAFKETTKTKWNELYAMKF